MQGLMLKVLNLKVAPGTLKKMIRYIETVLTLMPGEICKESVRNHNLTGYSKSHESPLFEIEEMIVDFCLRLARMGQGLTKKEVIDVAVELIKGTVHEDRLNMCKSLRRIDNGNGLGRGWYGGFLKRNKGKIKTKKSRVQCSNRSECCSYNNFRVMYLCMMKFTSAWLRLVLLKSWIKK
jgi:hypothetical protein